MRNIKFAIIFMVGLTVIAFAQKPESKNLSQTHKQSSRSPSGEWPMLRPPVIAHRRH
jgi:hypothetical protein